MCWKCGKNIDTEIIGRSSECPYCHKDLHSCKNCSFYEPGSHYDCHETISDPVGDKEKANFCDSFKVKRQWSGTDSKADEKAKAAKSAFDALFS